MPHAATASHGPPPPGFFAQRSFNQTRATAPCVSRIPRRRAAAPHRQPSKAAAAVLAAAAEAAAAQPAAGTEPAQLQQQQQQQQQQQMEQQQISELPLLLTGVRVVLVAPKTPVNIGAVLRVAENFEAHDVVVVDPRCDARGDDVAVTSCNSRVMHSMRVVPSLADALADCTGSIGFTRRAGAGRVVHASMQQLLARFPAAVPALLVQQPSPGSAADAVAAAGSGTAATNVAAAAADNVPAGSDAAVARASEQAVQPAAAAVRGTVALVFGREESGLLESELLLCSHACAIPTGRSQPSLNLSHAVAVTLSQLFDAKQQRLLLEQQQQQQTQQQDAAEKQLAQEGEQQQQRRRGGEDGGEQQGGGGGSLLPSGSLFETERTRWQRELALTAASQSELEALLQRAAALLEAAGISAEESIGGGDKSNHGRKKRLMGHVRSLLLRSQASTAEVRSLHGLCKELEGRQQRQQQQQQAD